MKVFCKPIANIKLYINYRLLKARRILMSVNIDFELLNHIALHFKNSKSKMTKQHQIYNIRHLVAPLNFWLKQYNIDTPLRVAHFLAQACCETFQYSALTEYPAHGGKEYDAGTKIGRKFGNNLKGDGPRYIGRGLLHLTGRFNYQLMGKRINVDLINEPTLVASDLNIAVRTACEYWTMRSCNLDADRDQFDAIMVKINGGTYGREERLNALNRAKKYLKIL